MLCVPQRTLRIPLDAGKLPSEKASPDMKALKRSLKRENFSILLPLKFIRNVLKAIHSRCVVRRLRTTPGSLLFLFCMPQN